MADFAFRPKLILGYGHSFPEEGRHVQLFGIEHEGARVGHVHTELSKEDPSNIHIENIEVDKGPNSLGPSHIKSLTKQLKEYYPAIKSASGIRITGARGNGKTGPVVKVKI